MLHAEHDTPLIRNALHRRLDKERGVRIDDIKFLRTDTHLQVRVEIEVGGALNLISEFDLPNTFEHGHLINEIDEIAEACKRARMEFWLSGRPVFEGRRELPGTGLRGNWCRYG